MACFPSAKNTSAMLYDNILPWLNQKPILANIPASANNANANASASAASGSGGGGGGGEEVDWRPPPLSSDTSQCLCVMEALFYSSRAQGLSSSAAEAAVVVIKAQIISMMHWDLGVAKNLSASDELLVHAACRQMARYATQKTGQGNLSVTFLDQLLACIKSAETKARSLAAMTSAKQRFTIPLVTDDQVCVCVCVCACVCVCPCVCV